MMIRKIFIILFLSFPLLVSAQKDMPRSLRRAKEVLPLFPGCDAKFNNDKRLECFDRSLGQFIVRNLTYPKEAVQAGKEGTVYVEFIIDSTGYIVDVKNKKPEVVLGYGMEEEALRVISALPRMQPGTQKGKPTRLKYIVPIQFKMN